VLADIIMYLRIRHISILSNSKVPGTWCSSKAEAIQEIGMMMAILPSPGRDISNLSSSSRR
jgi:hypothetical protein